MTVLAFENIVRYYRNGHNVLDGVGFEVQAGEVVGLLGRNGAGKTTLIQIALGVLRAQSGTVSVFGLDPAVDPMAVKQQVGYVSEDQILPEFLKVSEVLTLHRGLFPGWDADLEKELLTRFEIRTGAKIKELSKGEARQVALLCAVAHRPKLLLLDEPAGGLDPAVRREFLETSIQLLNDAGTTILFSSHYMTDVERMAGRIVMLHSGKILVDDALDNLQERFSMVLLPLEDGMTEERARALPGCIAVRRRNGSIHAILRMGREEGLQAVRQAVGAEGIRCETIPLEEMFIELLGGQP
ncbi:MAG: ABC transporter ATP-binding protein [Acidobacteria bacterium]|uniref:ABC transporter ATP-binding protein n=1 Tax=Candidatus Polarisedimenticola svalbardensis TaxID=2886004 RepID=A0A8J7C3T4_9BACT|nr:ABC transporter ATP-binding protein [Candidatus Polarisedimenticola svalbardensis]